MTESQLTLTKYLNSFSNKLTKDVKKYLNDLLTDPKLNISVSDLYNSSNKYIINNVLPKSKLHLDINNTEALSFNLWLGANPRHNILETDSCIVQLRYDLVVGMLKHNSMYVKSKFRPERAVFFKKSNKLLIDTGCRSYSKYISISKEFYKTVKDYCKIYCTRLVNKIKVYEDSGKYSLCKGDAKSFNNPFWDKNTDLLMFKLDSKCSNYLINSQSYKSISRFIKRFQYQFKVNNKTVDELLFKTLNLKQEQKIYIFNRLCNKSKFNHISKLRQEVENIVRDNRIHNYEL